MEIENILNSMEIYLPTPLLPIANYVSVQRTGDLIFTSGAGPFWNGEIKFNGKLGKDLTVEQGYDAARLTAINMLAAMKAYLGDLDRIEQIIKITGFVASTPDFYSAPKVINGASDLFVQVLGEKGKHARTAVQVPSLPMDTPVEIEAIVRIKD